MPGITLNKLLIKPKNAIFNDINIWLINLYKMIKNKLSQVKIELKKLNNNKYNCKEQFYLIREKYNMLKNKKNLSEQKKIEMAAIFIYLNKRSFNGLYRENKNVKYNVPFRKYNSSIYNETDIDNLSKYLNKNKIDFKSVSYNNFLPQKFKKDDLIYIDPPYYPCNKSSFTSYWKTPFLIEEQIKLSNYCKELDKRGCKFIVSNSPCQEIKNLYNKYNMKTFYIGRQMRNAQGKSDVFQKKNEDNEILIWNFDITENNNEVFI